MLIIQILILITLFLLSKTHSYLYVPAINLSKIIKNYQNFLGKGLKDQFIGMNIKKKWDLKYNQWI